MPFLVEAISSEWILDIISGVFSLAVDTFERIRAGFTCFCFEPGRVGITNGHLLICGW